MKETLYSRLRAEFSAGDREKNEGLASPEDVLRFDDILYDTADPDWNRLDVYLPKYKKGPFPVIISVHGGAWVYGCKEGYQYYCMSLAQYGFAVVNFSYRLAPEHPVTDELVDTDHVVKWVLGHCGEYQLDAERIFMVGDSAGGNLAAIYAGICTNPGFAARYSIKPPEDFAPLALGLNCGVFDLFMEVVDGESNTRDILREIFHTENPVEFLPLLNAIDGLSSKFPPVCLITAEQDFLRPQSHRMKEALDSFGIPCLLYDCVGRKVPLWHDFHTHMKEEEAREVNEKQCNFFLDIAGRRRP